MPTVSVQEREFLKFVMNNTPTNRELRAKYSSKMVETMVEKALVSKTNGHWRLSLTGQEALKQRPEIRRAFSQKAGQDSSAPAPESCPEEQLALPLEIRGVK